MVNIVMGIIAAALIITGAVILMSAGRACSGFVRADARLLEVTRGEARGHVKPIVELVLDAGPRRAVCSEMARSKLSAQPGDIVDVIYKPRGKNGFSEIYVDQTGDALRSRAAVLRISGIMVLVVGAVFAVLAAVI